MIDFFVLVIVFSYFLINSIVFSSRFRMQYVCVRNANFRFVDDEKDLHRVYVMVNHNKLNL